MMPNPVTLAAILLPNRRIASAASAPIPDARWRTMGCTGPTGADICFVTAKVHGRRWYTRVSPAVLASSEAGLDVTLVRCRGHASERLSPTM